VESANDTTTTLTPTAGLCSRMSKSRRRRNKKTNDACAYDEASRSINVAKPISDYLNGKHNACVKIHVRVQDVR
jgi:hypothetical protein